MADMTQYATKGDIGNLQENIEEIVKSDLQEFKEEIITHMNEMFDRLIAYMDKRFEALELRMDRLEARMDKLEPRVNELEKRIVQVELERKELRSEFHMTISRVDNHDTRLMHVEGLIRKQKLA